jgi:hypothetical protein
MPFATTKEFAAPLVPGATCDAGRSTLEQVLSRPYELG